MGPEKVAGATEVMEGMTVGGRAAVCYYSGVTSFYFLVVIVRGPLFHFTVNLRFSDERTLSSRCPLHVTVPHTVALLCTFHYRFHPSDKKQCSLVCWT